MTVRDYCLRWLETRTARLAPNAVRAYRSALVHHVIPHLGDHDLAGLTTRDVRDWLKACLIDRADNSVRAWQGALSTVLTDALIDGVVLVNAAHGAGRRLYRGRAMETPKAMVPEQVHALLVASRLTGSHWACDAFTLCSRTGLRLGELLGLTAEHALFLDVGALRTERTYHGCGRFGPPKGGRARLVELSPGTVQLLERLADQATPPHRILFPGQRPDRPLHPSTVEWAFERAVEVASLPAHFTVHALRHTYASRLLAAGAPAQFVQRQMGHASYGITVDLYGSWLIERRPDLVAILDDEPHHRATVRLERPRVGPGTVIPMAKHRRR